MKVKGALTVPPNRDEAVDQRFYFCPRKTSLANSPHWSNVKYPHFVVASESIPDCIIADTNNALGIPKVCWYYRILLVSSVFFSVTSGHKRNTKWL